MADLIDAENIGGRIQRTWLHYGDDGRKKLTTEIIQDVEPVIDNAKMLAENVSKQSILRFKAHVTGTQLEEACRIAARLWGIKFHECVREVMQGKTDRAQRIWRTLTEGRDYAKLQAKYWK